MHMSICINMLWERRQESLFRVDMYVPKTSIGNETEEFKWTFKESRQKQVD